MVDHRAEQGLRDLAYGAVNRRVELCLRVQVVRLGGATDLVLALDRVVEQGQLDLVFDVENRWVGLGLRSQVVLLLDVVAGVVGLEPLRFCPVLVARAAGLVVRRLGSRKEAAGVGLCELEFESPGLVVGEVVSGGSPSLNFGVGDGARLDLQQMAVEPALRRRSRT